MIVVSNWVRDSPDFLFLLQRLIKFDDSFKKFKQDLKIKA